ncbi:hypothetical protein D3C76_785890 [compost metagenome]
MVAGDRQDLRYSIALDAVDECLRRGELPAPGALCDVAGEKDQVGAVGLDVRFKGLHDGELFGAEMGIGNMQETGHRCWTSSIPDRAWRLICRPLVPLTTFFSTFMGRLHRSHCEQQLLQRSRRLLSRRQSNGQPKSSGKRRKRWVTTTGSPKWRSSFHMR